MLIDQQKVLRALACLALLYGCAEGDAASRAADDSDDVDDDVVQEEEQSAKSTKDAGRKDAGSADASKPAAKSDAATPAAMKDASMAGPMPKSQGLPCEIAAIVSTHCAECHGDDTDFGAPFSLTSLSHFQQPSPDDASKKIHQVAHTVVSDDGAKRMPPPSKPAIPAPDLKKLSDWLAGGAKAMGESCPVSFKGAAAGDAGMERATAGSGGAHIKPIEYNDPELKCYPFVSFGKSDRKAKYTVPTTPDFYVAFTIKAPWTGTQYIRSFRGIIDNKDVIHHWLFFKNLTAQQDGRIQENALGAHPDGEMMFGWAPGGDDMYMDPDVGMAVSGGDTYLLEAHYNNTKGAGQMDASGVEVCVTPKKPEHVAALTWIGTDAISSTSATGQCNSTHSTPVRIFSAQPHMHVKGKHMKVVVNRKNGMKETIHDQPFSFEYQRSYTLDVTLQPGDTLTTTCTYSAPARFGKGTNDEMCYFFANSWPAGALTMPGIGTIIHGPNSCL